MEWLVDLLVVAWVHFADLDACVHCLEMRFLVHLMVVEETHSKAVPLMGAEAMKMCSIIQDVSRLEEAILTRFARDC